MQPTTASKTALATALMRALHTRADPHRILDDPWGDRLVPEVVRTTIHQRVLDAIAAGHPAAAGVVDTGGSALVDGWLRGNPAYANIITRSRYAEDALHDAIARGCTQYVLVGAGFDSYALRRPPQAAHLQVYEVDHPATQQLKRMRIAECGLAVGDATHFLAADLAAESLESVLGRSGYDRSKPAFYAWLGVTMYLPREANQQALRGIARSAAPGSELVFTYVDQAAFDRREIGGSLLGQSVASIGEPFLSGFDPKALAHELQEAGFELLEDLTDFQLVERYDPQGLNGLKPLPHSRIARARVAGQ